MGFVYMHVYIYIGTLNVAIGVYDKKITAGK